MKVLGADVGSMAVGAGVVLFGPFVFPFVGKVLRPVAKAVIKTGLLAYEQAKEAVGEVQRVAAEGMETIEDLSAEAKAEMSGEIKSPKVTTFKPKASEKKDA